MRARVVFHDGTSEKPDNVLRVYEDPDRIELNVEGNLRPLVYAKDKVAFFQVVWHS